MKEVRVLTETNGYATRMLTFFHLLDIILHNHGWQCGYKREVVRSVRRGVGDVCGGVSARRRRRDGSRPGHFPALRPAEEAHDDRSRNHRATPHAPSVLKLLFCTDHLSELHLISCYNLLLSVSMTIYIERPRSQKHLLW